MPIRTHRPPKTASASKPSPSWQVRNKFREIKKELDAATKAAPGRGEWLSDTEAKGLIDKAKAGGDEVLGMLKDELLAAVDTGKIAGKPFKLGDAALEHICAFIGFEIDTARKNIESPPIKVAVPADLTDDERVVVAEKATAKLIGTVTEHKDVAGTGQEASGGGDPRINERRNAVSTLIANKEGGAWYLAAIKGLGPNVEKDVLWLDATRRDFSVDGGSDQFSFSKSSMATSGNIHTEFKRRTASGKKQAEALDAGTQKAYDASKGRTVGISMIQDPDVRANALVDTLLQFRARTDLANQTEVSSGSSSTRLDQLGPAMIAEQRILLAAADLSTDDPVKMREFALLREVIASHPMNSVNGIFEARNAVGKLFLDGGDWSSKTHDMAWVRWETPPGGSASAYASIHHNFSRDTPVNIKAAIDAWVFPVGNAANRATTFVGLVEVLDKARGGDNAGAKASLERLKLDSDPALKDLASALKNKSGEQLGDAIVDFILEHAEKPLESDQKATLLKTAESLIQNATSSYPSTYKYKNARKMLAELAENPAAAKVLKPLMEKLDSIDDKELGNELKAFVEGMGDSRFPGKLEQNLGHLATLYNSVCEGQPSAESLERNLFKAGSAWKDVADAVDSLRGKKTLNALMDLGEARLSMRDAIVNAGTGFERHELIKFDADLSRLTNTELGALAEEVGDLKTDDQRAKALIGVQVALQSAIASGLDQLIDHDDPASTKGRPLGEVLQDVTAALDAGTIGEQDYRHLMADVAVGVATCNQNTRSLFDARKGDVTTLGAELDPMFEDQFAKQSPLHYATMLAQKGMRAGLKEEIGARCIKNVEGMRILNSVGPVVFANTVFAENTKELVKLKPPKDAMSVLYGLEEKKMVAVGGLIVDDKDAPGGNSHLNMYAMNNGITVLALPELRTKYTELFENAKTEGGLYVDDSNGEFQMMTVGYALEQGIIQNDDLERLRPGTNRKITYLKSKGLGQGHEKVGYHEAIISPERKTREVELFIPMDEVNGLGRSCVSFKDLATLGIHGRHLAGEKGTVLALLKANPKIADSVPDGSMVTTGRCRALLEEAGIADEWDAIFKNDPDVGIVDDDNFLKSKFYTDADFRSEKRQHLQDLTKETLTSHLLVNVDQTGRPDDVSEKDIKHMSNELARFDGAWPYEEAKFNPGGKSVKGDDAFKKQIEEQFGKSIDEMRDLVGKFAPSLTDAGKTLYNELRDNPAMSDSDNWITRSSFTGEDRPGKSGAGQYESFFHLRDPVSRIDGVIGVMESTWMPEPVENNVADEVNLKHIMPAVVVQHCLQPSESGVMISRDIEHGTRGQVYFQLVKGFGGGVEGGKTEEGTITASGHRVKIPHPDAPDGLVPAEDLKKLREIVLETENYFNEVVEKGKGYAVDMEVARVDGQWAVVQARVIQIDK